MFVFIDENLDAVLKEASDFSRFHLEVAAPHEKVKEIEEQLGQLVIFADDGSAWISVAGLRDLYRADRWDAWNASLAGMIDKARPHGWIRDEPEPAIKAHVVWSS